MMREYSVPRAYVILLEHRTLAPSTIFGGPESVNYRIFVASSVRVGAATLQKGRSPTEILHNVFTMEDLPLEAPPCPSISDYIRSYERSGTTRVDSSFGRKTGR
ncbi:Hypothetical protein CINCED_3A020990 [Cinara cedri]|uniref:Uncharacterized protein n=1 Tax=Cinara cedri TaxID=506608 RepID=A0A5E4NK08_9HEMI|nr:Hypothetical protein CINCED_3A020990 [Cinara cedri]